MRAGIAQLRPSFQPGLTALMVHQTAVLGLGPSDVVSCLSLNWDSTLLASSSADHSVTIASIDPTTLTFSTGAQGSADGKTRTTFKAHDSAVLCLSWAHPEFGSVLATGAVDGSVKIWVTERRDASKWHLRATLNDARGSVRAVEFGHREFGLKLATLASDSRLRVYECLDPVKAEDWSMTDDIDLSSLPATASTPLPSSSISIGAQRNDSPAKAGTAMSSTASNSSSDGRKTGSIESDGAWSLSWLKEHWWGERLAVSAGPSGLIRLFHLQPHSAWNNFVVIPSKGSPVSSLAFAPASGRSYQLLAAGSRDGRARIYRLRPPTSNDMQDDDEQRKEWTSELTAELDSGTQAKSGTSAVKVDWNLTGTVLSTAGDDGKVRLWKPTYTNEWRTVAVLGTENQ